MLLGSSFQINMNMSFFPKLYGDGSVIYLVYCVPNVSKTNKAKKAWAGIGIEHRQIYNYSECHSVRI